jgi:hypothetical protein
VALPIGPVAVRLIVMRWSPIVELRQYTLLPGQRDVLIDLFEAELVESQEECGMKVIGTFRDLDDPTKFVWLRGFQRLEDRPGGLGCFYDGSVWKRHREIANRTMVDSDDVLLLRAAHPGGGFALTAERPPLHAEGGLDRGIVEATIVHLDAPADGDVLAHFDQEIAPRVTQAGGSLLACFVSCECENNFPILPVREGEHVQVWFQAFPDRTSYEAARPALIAAIHAGVSLLPVSGMLSSLRLEPTRRSLLSGLTPAAIPASTV